MGVPSAPQVESAGPELVVVARRDAGLRVRATGLAAAPTADITPVEQILKEAGARMLPLFGITEERLLAVASAPAPRTGVDVPDMSVYYRVDAPEERLNDLAATLASQDAIEAAYVKPPAWPAVAPAAELNAMVPSAAAPPLSTPDFTAHQGYLDSAPGGIDARFAWTQQGG